MFKNAVEDRTLTTVSIRQRAFSDVLPDFRNLGVMARVLVAVNAAVAFGGLFAAVTLGDALGRFLAIAAFVEPLLLLNLVVLLALSPLLQRLSYGAGFTLVVGLVVGLTALYRGFLPGVVTEPLPDMWRTLALAGVVAAAVLGLLRLVAKAYSPALAEARLQALQARIRPHFLFNSLNAVLALVRRDPRPAERSLEDLADLFRTLMAEPRQFVRLADEIALLERYAELEQLRLGERLRITWELDAAPSDALLPPLVLQPLLENAVYHGVEPGTTSGEVLVRIERRGSRVLASIENPYHEAEQRRAGNRIALDNIRERLALFFDAEARVDTRAAGGRYRVEIEIPYRAAGAG